jgi:hypothetical protein
MEQVREAQRLIDLAVKYGQRTRRECLGGHLVLVERPAAWPEGDDPRFTLDEIRRALHADHYGEGRDDPDDPAAEFDHRRAEEQFKRLHDWLIYCRANPDAFRVPER